jgi:hypothetical protein
MRTVMIKGKKYKLVKVKDPHNVCKECDLLHEYDCTSADCVSYENIGKVLKKVKE